MDIRGAKENFLIKFRKRPYFISSGFTNKKGKRAIYIVLDGNKITDRIKNNLPTNHDGFEIVYRFQYEEVKKQQIEKGDDK